MAAAWATVLLGLLTMVATTSRAFYIIATDDFEEPLTKIAITSVGYLLLGITVLLSSLWIPDLWLR